MMSKFSSSFKKVADAKPISDFAQNIGLGRHIVALKAFRGKESQKKKDIFIEGEFVIMESDSEKIGATRGWAWFVNEGGWTGTYAAARMQEFILAIKESIGDDNEIDVLGDTLADEDKNPGYGISLEVEVVEVPDKDDPSKVMRNKKGKPIHNATWYSIEQNDEDIVATQEKMKTLVEVKPTKPEARKVEVAKPEVKTEPPVLAKADGGIRRLLGKS